ncbi:MAG: hypothetical protein RL653_1888 [Pseudomonadota bacterium]
MHCTHVVVALSQYAVGALHVVGAAYWPLLPHVKIWFPLHTLVFGVHALHCPAPLHVPPVHAVPWAFAV